MTHEILNWLLRGTLTASVAICAVLALRLVVRRWLGAQAAYVLWLLVPVAVLAMLLPAPARPLIEALRVAPALVGAAPAIMLDAAGEPAHLDPRPWLLAAWVAGVLAMLAALTWQQRRYLRALGPLSADGAGALRAQGSNGSPALVGALFPRIVLPGDFEARFDARERELVLAHERAHLGHGDAQVNALVALLRCLQWFNPLLHFAATRLRIDQELACDARVIARFPEARRPYADAMLKAQLIGEARQELRLPIGCYWPSSHPLKERISMLKLPVPTRMRRAIASVVAMVLALGAGYTSWAAQPGGVRDAGASLTSGDASSATSVGARFLLAIDGEQVIDTLDVDAASKRNEGAWHVEMRPGNEVHFLRSAAHQGLLPISSDGSPFSISATRGSEKWELGGIAKRAADGTFDFAAMIVHNDAVVSKPRLVVRDGEPAAVEVGEKDANGRLKGVRLELTLLQLTQAQTRAPKMTKARLSDTGGDTTPTENLEFRKVLPPRYPPEAVKANMQGKVMLKVQIDAEGVPLGTEVVSVEPKEANVLADASIAAAMSWRYKPGMTDGKPVGGFVLVPVDFALRDDEMHATPPSSAPQSVIAASYRRMRPPAYPPTALAERLTGTVWVRAHLNPDGAVTEAHAEQTYPLAASELAEAAVAAIRGWTFNPATVDGTPIEGEVVVPLHFAIDGYTPKATGESEPAFPPQTPLLAMVTITGPHDCGKDCPPPPPPPPAPVPPPPKPPLPAQPVNAAAVTPAIFDIFPTDEQHC